MRTDLHVNTILLALVVVVYTTLLGCPSAPPSRLSPYFEADQDELSSRAVLPPRPFQAGLLVLAEKSGTALPQRASFDLPSDCSRI
jgi:hypothetical protein